MPKQRNDYFSTRWGFILSLMGVAVGAGNIWRFSRVVAQNGGGSFIIPWIIFLFSWSIPLIVAEVAMGKLTRKAPIGALAKTAGKKFGWMGAFIALVTTGILFYYSVVVGWGFRYLLYSVSGTLASTGDHQAIWEGYTQSFQPMLTHVIAILVGVYVIYKGIVHGIEKSNKILIPALLTMILIIFVRAITLRGAWAGIQYFFTPNFADLLNIKLWLEALTQNAWDTGAGWGLLLVYACYMKRDESVITNGALAAFANNAVSLVMGMTIFAAAFALESSYGILALQTGEGATNVGLTFIYLPQLFRELPGGIVVQSTFATLFFFAFTSAALSSMISMMKLTSKVFNELGMSRNGGIWLTGGLALVFGIPSAISMKFFENQDWVWSVGLIMSGLFISIGVIRYGVDRFRREVVNGSPSDFNLGKFYNGVIGIWIPVQAVILVSWYFFQSITEFDSVGWWNPFRVYSVGTILFQWGIGLIVFIALNRWLVRQSLQNSSQEKLDP